MMRYTGLTVFILFFGIAMYEAIIKFNWIEAIIYTLLGVLFVVAEKRK
ncbi:MAG: hypothetical protein IPH11_15310 [Ignavibacteriales bacterium]|nr:hypothetical protein [Ignavibacteriales bacterium]